MSKCFTCGTQITETGQDASYDWNGEAVCASCYVEYADNKIATLQARITELKAAMKDNCPTSMVMCGCGKHYKKPSQPVCSICSMFDLTKELAGYKLILTKIKNISSESKLHRHECECLTCQVRKLTLIANSGKGGE